MILPCRNPVHLYRSLLREAGYLFDPFARDFHKDHIRWSFNRQRAKEPSPFPKQSQDGTATLLSQLESKQLKRARKYLYMLQRANQGHLRATKNVLRLTYAGVGKSRRLLLQDVMTPTSSTNAPTSPPPTPSKFDRNWKPPSKFANLLKNQSLIQPHLHGTKRKIQPMPVIPQQNRWKRPFPMSRIKGVWQKWYARHADIIMPPLQETQWLKIYQMAMKGAKNTEYQILKRRSIGSVPVFVEPTYNTTAAWMDKIDDLIRTSAQRPEYSKRIRRVIGHPHNMTNRFLRRTMQRAVLESTPTVVVDPSTGKSAYRREPGGTKGARPLDCTQSQELSLFD